MRDTLMKAGVVIATAVPLLVLLYLIGWIVVDSLQHPVQL
jgi:phage shock protein PspC (stress-responsive transcriptional regulator)